ncbi:hypothetical protein ACTXML_16975 [Glutamicibacter arilaitensis]|uniref:hypothetical protein n=1 Tax=Glutamicibacter arilaitensis TaxID=256701 RepID=UPI003FD07BDC
MKNIPRVLAIGSCRVTRPLRRMSDLGLVDLVNKDHLWLNHTSASARQYVDIINGKMSIPLELRSVAIEADKEFPSDMSADFGRLDAVIVEVSSYKQHSIDGVELNAHMVAGLAKKAEADYRFIIEGRTEQLSDDHLLKPLNVSFTSQQDLEDNLLYIRNSLDVPVITVDHLFTLREDGSRVPAREKLTKMLEQVEITHKIPFYSTEDTIVSHGTQSALADQNLTTIRLSRLWDKRS